MKTTIILYIALLLAGCAAKLNFIDRSNGKYYTGTTSSTIGGSGEINASIENKKYSGTWIYSSTGGSIGFSSLSGTGTATNYGPGGTSASTFGSSFATGSAIGISAQGRGLINMQSDTDEFIRCVFDFNTLSNTGIGECQRSDGRIFDLTIKR